MIVIPGWITNVLLLATCVLAAYQHWRLNRENTVRNLQFIAIACSMVMVLVVVLYSRRNPNPWVSLVFFLIAVTGLSLVIRQHRTLPPSRAYE